MTTLLINLTWISKIWFYEAITCSSCSRKSLLPNILPRRNRGLYLLEKKVGSYHALHPCASLFGAVNRYSTLPHTPTNFCFSSQKKWRSILTRLLMPLSVEFLVVQLGEVEVRLSILTPLLVVVKVIVVMN